MSDKTREDAAMREYFATEGSIMPARIGYVLAAADAHDAANGVHRVSLDEAAVEKVARTLFGAIGNNVDNWVYIPPEDEYRLSVMHMARAVLAAAVTDDEP